MLVAPRWSSLSTAKKAEVLGTRLFAVNLVLEIMVGLELVALPYPGDVHRWAVALVYARIVGLDLWKRTPSLIMGGGGGKQSEASRGGGKRKEDKEDDEEDDDEEDDEEEEDDE